VGYNLAGIESFDENGAQPNFLAWVADNRLQEHIDMRFIIGQQGIALSIVVFRLRLVFINTSI